MPCHGSSLLDHRGRIAEIAEDLVEADGGEVRKAMAGDEVDVVLLHSVSS